MNLTINDRQFYNKLLQVAIPVMIQQLIIVAVGLCDTIMVGKLSEEALAAVGAANQVFIVYIDCVFGFLSGVSVFSIQYWGIRDLKALRKLLGIAYSMVLALGIPATVICYCKATFLVGLFSDDPEVIAMGAEYLRVVVFTYIIGALTYVISYNCRTVAMLTWPTIFNAIAVGINIFLNWCFIFGKLGFPELGVKGAAVATLISRIIEFMLTALYILLSKDHPLHAGLGEMKYTIELYKRVMKTAVPVILNELLWVLSFTATFAIYGKLGPVALAVVQICMTISDAFMAVFCGLGNGCAVIVGQELGKGNKDEAFRIAKKCIRIGWIFIAIATVILILARKAIVGIYDFEDSTNDLIMITLVVEAITFCPKILAYFFICGILRPGGDTVWCAVVDSGLNWLLSIPLALLSVKVFVWTLPACMAFVSITEIVKDISCYIRFYSKKWMNVFTGR